MSQLLPNCPHCAAPLAGSRLNQPVAQPCLACGRELQVLVFPALFRPPAPRSGAEERLAEAEAGCFYHASKRALVVCDGCGRFLCGLCDVELQDQHYCPPCLETGRKQNRLPQLEGSRLLYDNVAIGVALAPLLTGLVLPLSPLAIGVVFWAWGKPSSLVRRTKLRFLLAIVLAVATSVGSLLVWLQILRN